jgi:hypothetical protein
MRSISVTSPPVAAAAAAAAASPAAGNANGNGNGNANGSVTVGVQQQYAQYLDGPGGAYCLIEQVSSLLLEYPFTYLPPGRAGGRLLSDRAGETRRSVRGTGGGVGVQKEPLKWPLKEPLGEWYGRVHCLILQVGDGLQT